MATPRRGWYKQPTSISREGWPRDVIATAVLLQAFMIDRWARDGLSADQACRVLLTAADLHHITGRSQRAHASRALRALGARVSLAIRTDGELTEIYWPKFSEVQGLASRGREETGSPMPKSAYADADATKTPPSGVSEDALADAKRWANTLGKEPGSRDEKVAFLAEQLPLIEQAATASFADKKPTAAAKRAKVKELIIRFWRTHRRNPGGPRGRARTTADVFADLDRLAAQGADPQALLDIPESERNRR